MTNLKPHDLCLLGIGRTFQVPQIFPDMTVRDNIMVGAFAKESNAKKALSIANISAESLKLTTRFDHFAVGLTAWEAKMVELAGAFSTQPKLLLL